jgi:heavy-metal-associated domain-containing protein
MIGPFRARVAHSIPGRLRVRFEPREADPEVLAALLAQLSHRPGVRSARYNPASGSVVVEYDPGALSEAALMGALPVVPAPAARETEVPTTSTPAARAVSRGWWEADAFLARASGGRMDMKLLLPLALALLAVRQLVLQGELGAAPWHALLWYSYNLFYQFHPEMRGRP